MSSCPSCGESAPEGAKWRLKLLNTTKPRRTWTRPLAAGLVAVSLVLFGLLMANQLDAGSGDGQRDPSDSDLAAPTTIGSSLPPSTISDPAITQDAPQNSTTATVAPAVADDAAPTEADQEPIPSTGPAIEPNFTTLTTGATTTSSSSAISSSSSPPTTTSSTTTPQPSATTTTAPADWPVAGRIAGLQPDKRGNTLGGRVVFYSGEYATETSSYVNATFEDRITNTCFKAPPLSEGTSVNLPVGGGYLVTAKYAESGYISLDLQPNPNSVGRVLTTFPCP